jgi:hypothetical protein
MHRALTLLLVITESAVLQAGCASSRGIVPVGKDQFVLVKHEVASFPGRFNFRSEIVAEALNHCAKTGKTMSIVEAMEQPAPNIIVNYRWARIKFECVPPRERRRPGAPESSRPNRSVA